MATALLLWKTTHTGRLLLCLFILLFGTDVYTYEPNCFLVIRTSASVHANVCECNSSKKQMYVSLPGLFASARSLT